MVRKLHSDAIEARLAKESVKHRDISCTSARWAMLVPSSRELNEHRCEYLEGTFQRAKVLPESVVATDA